MILADTNILIDYYRNQDVAFNKKFDSLEIGICGIVKSELLHGARTDDEADNMIKSFSSFELITIDEYDWEFSGLMLQTIRTQGFSMPVTDVLIAYLGIKYDIPVWTKDHHFKIIQAVYPELKLYEQS
ncbi:MAG: PIN domain-containing protein [Treponema sp.]|nr:PIN domain-containing protein [Treponema sp.]